jgi:hypothetical protein
MIANRKTSQTKQTTNKQTTEGRNAQAGEEARAKADEQMRREHLASVSVAAELQVNLAQPAVHTASRHDPRTVLARSLAQARTLQHRPSSACAQAAPVRAAGRLRTPYYTCKHARARTHSLSVLAALRRYGEAAYRLTVEERAGEIRRVLRIHHRRTLQRTPRSVQCRAYDTHHGAWP